MQASYNPPAYWLQVSPDEPLMAAGLDSLGSVELRNTLESSLALPLPPTLVMDYPTAAAIAAYAAAKMPSPASQHTSSPAPAGTSRMLPPAAEGDVSWAWFDGEDTSSYAFDAYGQAQLQPPAAGMAAVQPLSAVESGVSAAVASILGKSISSSDALMASGLDSLASVELQNVLQASYSVRLPATLALDYPSVTAIAGYIHSKLAATAGAATHTQAAAVGLVSSPVRARPVAHTQPLGVFGMAFVLPSAGASNLQGHDAVGVVPLER